MQCAYLLIEALLERRVEEAHGNQVYYHTAAVEWRLINEVCLFVSMYSISMVGRLLPSSRVAGLFVLLLFWTGVSNTETRPKGLFEGMVGIVRSH